MSKKPLIMGIVNLSKDSFSDGGKINSSQQAIKKIRELFSDGAEIVDIGVEASGPGSKFVTEEEEKSALAEIFKNLKKEEIKKLSIDTYKPNIAEFALKMGVKLINDIRALGKDGKMAEVVYKYGGSVIIMYSKDKDARTTIKPRKYANVVKTVCDFLENKIEIAKQMGLKDKNIIIDPGMGHFVSSIPKYSYEIIAKIGEIKKRFPKNKIAVGISRKSFIGGNVVERDEKSHLLEGIAYLNGASIIRTHDVLGLKNNLNKLFQNAKNET